MNVHRTFNESILRDGTEKKFGEIRAAKNFVEILEEYLIDDGTSVIGFDKKTKVWKNSKFEESHTMMAAKIRGR